MADCAWIRKDLAVSRFLPTMSWFSVVPAAEEEEEDEEEEDEEEVAMVAAKISSSRRSLINMVVGCATAMFFDLI